MTTGTCVPTYEYLPFPAPLVTSSVMPNLHLRWIFDVDAATPVIEEQTLELLMDYEENVFLDPVTANSFRSGFLDISNCIIPMGYRSSCSIY